MKTGIHPTYHRAKVTCACGASFEVGSTKEDVFVDTCSSCHSFYTGEVNTATMVGRAEKFKARMEAFESASEKAAKAQDAGAKAPTAKKDDSRSERMSLSELAAVVRSEEKAVAAAKPKKATKKTDEPEVRVVKEKATKKEKEKEVAEEAEEAPEVEEEVVETEEEAA